MYEAGFTIRPPRPEDAKKLADLMYRFYAFNEEFDPAWVLGENAEDKAREEASKLASGETADIAFIAEFEGSIVGYIRGYLRALPMLKESIVGVITELYVHPRFRGRKIGALLIERFAEEARRRGASRIAAEIPSNNVVAERFYSKLGFRKFMTTFIREV